MARGFRMGVGGGSTSTRRYLYNKGIIGTSFTNPAYWWDSSADNNATIASQFLSDKIYAPTVSGKLYTLATKKIDLTRYSSIHIKAKRLDTLSSIVALMINASTSFAGYARRIAITQNTLTEYSLDISDINASYYITVITTNYSQGFEIEAIWLE